MRVYLHECRVVVLGRHVDEGRDAARRLHRLLEVGVHLEGIDHRLDITERARLGSKRCLVIKRCLVVVSRAGQRA